MKKLVVFNALQTSLNDGIGRYSYELSKELYINNPQNIKIVIRNQDIKLFDFAKKEDLIIVYNINNSKERNIYEQFKLPKIIYKKFPDAIVHYPDTMAPILSKNKVVITIHDLAFKSLKEVFTWKTVLWKNIITSLSIRKADKIIAITKFTENEIIKHYPKINKNKISVIFNGFNDFSKEKINEKNVSNQIKNMNKEYILTVSTLSPRKNIDGLINAFYAIKDEITENLVIAGKNGWMYEKIYKLVEALKLKDRVIFTGKVNDDELKYLYKSAKIFVYVSFYEGFGFPPLEAMGYGVPCLVSNTSSIPEVVGDAAIQVNPKNIDEISKKIEESLMCNNKEVIIKGRRKVQKFSWKKCAKDVFKEYKMIL